MDNLKTRVIKIIKILQRKHQHVKIKNIIVVAVKCVTLNKKIKKYNVKIAIVILIVKKIYKKYFSISI